MTTFYVVLDHDNDVITVSTSAKKAFAVAYNYLGIDDLINSGGFKAKIEEMHEVIALVYSFWSRSWNADSSKTAVVVGYNSDHVDRLIRERGIKL